MANQDQDDEVKSGTEFLSIFGVIFIIIGIAGAIGFITSFDWEAYNEAGSYSFGSDDDVIKPDIASMWMKAGASLLGSGAIGLFFIAVDKIALTLKKIQMGIKHDPESKESKSETNESEGYGSL